MVVKIVIVYAYNLMQYRSKISEIINENSLLKVLNVDIEEIIYSKENKVDTRLKIKNMSADILIFANNFYSSTEDKKEKDSLIEKFSSNFSRIYEQEDGNWLIFKDDIRKILLEIRENIYNEKIGNTVENKIDENFILHNEVASNVSLEIDSNMDDFNIDIDESFLAIAKEESINKVNELFEENDDEIKISVEKKLLKEAELPKQDIEQSYIDEDSFNKVFNLFNEDIAVSKESDVLEIKELHDEYEVDTNDIDFVNQDMSNDEIIIDDTKEEIKDKNNTNKKINIKIPSVTIPKLKIPNIDFKVKKSKEISENSNNYIPTGKDLGFFGNTNSVGTTFISLYLSNYFSIQNHLVNFIDMTDKNYKRLKKLEEDSKIKFKVFSKDDMNLAYRNKDAIKIIDFGVMNLNTKTNITDFERCNYKFIVGNTSILKINDFNVNIEYDNSDVYSIINLTSYDDLKEYKNMFNKLKIVTFPYIDDFYNTQIDSNIFNIFKE